MNATDTLTGNTGADLPEGQPAPNPADNAGAKPRRRPGRRQYKDDESIWKGEALRALLDNKDLFHLGDGIPHPNPGGRGRPATGYPGWVWILYSSLIPLFGSARIVSATLRDPHVWADVRAAAQKHAGADAAADLPRQGPRRHHWNYWAKKLEDVQAAILEPAFTAAAIAQAKEMGQFPDTTRSMTSPAIENTIVGDGKVIRSAGRGGSPQWVDEDTGDVLTRRVDVGSCKFRVGGEDSTHVVEGHKFVTLSARLKDEWNSRVVFGVRRQEPDGQGYGGEVGLAVQMIEEVHDQLEDRLHMVVWDGAMRGKHISRLMDRGLLAHATKISAAVAAKDGKPRVEKPLPLGTESYRHGGGTCEHHLFARSGGGWDVVEDDEGKLTWEPLVYRRPQGRKDVGGWRWYHETLIRCPFGDATVRDEAGEKATGHSHRVRITPERSQTEKKGRKGRSTPVLNEYLRQFPFKTPAAEAALGRRQDAESLNNQIERSWFNGRMPAWSGDRAALIMFGYSLLHNSVTRWVANGRGVEDPPQAA